MNQSRGLLIAFEGIDGTGKSSQLRDLASYLRGKGCRVVTTREPSEGPYGRQIRELYNNRAHYTLEQELALFLADRRQHVTEVIAPALAAGQIVLTDRYYFSTAAYQGAAGCNPEEIFVSNRFAPEPHLVLLLTMDAVTSRQRIQELRGDTPNEFEQEDTLRKVAEFYASFTHPCIRRIDAAGDFGSVRAAIRQEVDKLLRHQSYQCESPLSD